MLTKDGTGVTDNGHIMEIIYRAIDRKDTISCRTVDGFYSGDILSVGVGEIRIKTKDETKNIKIEDILDIG